MELDWHQVLNSLADAVVAADASGTVVYANSAAETLLGYSPGELSGRPLTLLMPGRLHGPHTAGFSRFLATRQPKLMGRPVRVPAVRRDGAEMDIELTLSALRVGDAELFLASLRDIRDRVELERQLTITRYLRAAARAAARLTSRLDVEQVLRSVVDTLVADFDAALARVWLYEPETNTLHLRASAGLSSAITESSRARIDVATYPYKVGVVARSRQPFIKNGLVGDPDFEPEWVERENLRAVAALPLTTAGELRGVLVYFSRQELHEEVAEVLSTFAALVVTSLNDAQLLLREQEARAASAAQAEQLRYQREELEVANEELQSQQEELVRANEALLSQEEELRRRVEQLREADQQKDQFLAMLAHELRNPLAPIRNAVQILQLLGPPEPRLTRAREIIERQVNHQAHLLDALLDVSRLTRGMTTLHKKRLDLSHLVRHAAEDCRNVMDEAGLTFSEEIPQEPVWVEGDPVRLAQSVGNLLANAAKFTERGGHVTLRLAAEAESERAVITVRDTGIGIDSEMLPRVFDIFAQADRSLNRSPGGLGLGLALVKGLVELHDGEVRAESEGLGRGSEFTILLPLATAPAVSEEVCVAAAPSTGATRVLIVEDNRDTAETLRDVLELFGCTVEVVYSGPAALEAARRFHPEIVLCDLGLPGMDGYEVATLLRQDPTTARARLIAVTGYGQEEDVQRSRGAGFELHLTKPVAPEKLQQVLAPPPTIGHG